MDKTSWNKTPANGTELALNWPSNSLKVLKLSVIYKSWNYFLVNWFFFFGPLSIRAIFLVNEEVDIGLYPLLVIELDVLLRQEQSECILSHYLWDHTYELFSRSALDFKIFWSLGRDLAAEYEMLVWEHSFK